MIIDQSALSGLPAYLIPDANGTSASVDLSRTPGVAGRSLRLWPGDTMQVSGIQLLLEAADLEQLFGWQSAPLLSVRVKKEMFPLLIEDPYANRVHNVGGFEDLQRGRGDSLRILEVGGIPTLVSAGQGATKWSSMIYRMAQPVRFSAAAWHLDGSRNVPADAFTYSLTLDLWGDGRPLTQPASESVNLATTLRPDDNRFARFTHDGAAAAYQIHFQAEVDHDSYLRERLAGLNDAESVGRPLLQAVNLLEPLEPVHEFHSLHELMLNSSEHELHWVPGSPLRRMTAVLDVSATLTGPDRADVPGESIELTVHTDAFTYVEARLAATVLVRPPRP
jgi:hypothetical protein